METTTFTVLLMVTNPEDQRICCRSIYALLHQICQLVGKTKPKKRTHDSLFDTQKISRITKVAIRFGRAGHHMYFLDGSVASQALMNYLFLFENVFQVMMKLLPNFFTVN